MGCIPSSLLSTQGAHDDDLKKENKIIYENIFRLVVPHNHPEIHSFVTEMLKNITLCETNPVQIEL